MTTEPRSREEAARLAALREYRIVDTAPESTYDEIARLAAYVCGTPTALITLIDEQRQWFKARVNFDAAETPRDIAFCAHTIAGRDVMVVNDTLRDERFARNELVVGGPKIRFYAGAPLIVRTGQCLGALAVIDRVPRQLDPGQLEALHALGRQVVAQLELRRLATEQKRLQREGAERFQLLARATNDAVWDWNLVTNEIWWSEGLRRLFGLPPDEVPTIEAWSSHLHPEDLTRVEQSLFAVIQSGHQYWSDEYRFRCEDGHYADIFDRGYVLHEDGKPVRMIGAMLDVSERRRLEDQLRQSQKMEAIGQLSGGVAHDFNNLLTVIQVNAALIMRDQASSKSTREHAGDIIGASDRAAALTRQLLMVSRKQVMQQSVVDVNDIVRNMMRMLHRALGADVVIDAHCSTQLPLVKADVGMLEQVLLNLAVNARDAMPSGGQLTISTGEKFISDPQPARGFEVKPGPHVFVAVSDTGTGIDPQALPHIFEPFFTTKDIGKGSGLGLATVYGIIRQHHGWIDVASQAGRGTTFCFYLPVTTEPRRSDDKRTTDDTELPTGTETILLVEDEDALRNLMVGLLEKCGYTVIAARSGAHAVELWPTVRDRVDLLLTDLVMPGGVTGRELAERLRADQPTMRVLYTSGYTATQAGSGEPLMEGHNFLQKPFQPDRLALLVREVLDRGT